MNDRTSTKKLFPKTELKEDLSVEEVNRRVREKADAEELAHMKYIKHLNYINKINRTGADSDDFQIDII